MRAKIVALAGTALLMAAGAGADENSSLKAVGEGRALYLTHCASCHGPDGHGLEGPGLDAIAQRDGSFRRLHVANHIFGRGDGVARGPMPNWGFVLQDTWPRGRDGAALKTWKLTKYLEFVQAGAPQQVAASAAPR